MTNETDQMSALLIKAVFGLESVVRDELLELGFDAAMITLDDGQVALRTNKHNMPAAVARCNIWLRCAERVYLVIGEAQAPDFDALYDISGSFPWEEIIPRGWAFHISGYSRQSALFGISACQSIIKKSIVTYLAKKQGLGQSDRVPEDEQLGLVKITFSIVKNQVSFWLDTTGDGLHKRGYRPLAHPSPIRETLAAGIIMLSQWPNQRHEALLDPMCGSGTIPIEAAMIACHIAPGLNRSFAAQKHPLIGQEIFMEQRQLAIDAIQRNSGDAPAIFGGDIVWKNVELAQRNAKAAGVIQDIRFLAMDATKLNPERIRTFTGRGQILIVTNPPYGERVMDKQEATDIYRRIGAGLLSRGKVAQGLRLTFIAPVSAFEEAFGAVADKRRKLYNGQIPCNMYHYFKSNRETPGNAKIQGVD